MSRSVALAMAMFLLVACGEESAPNQPTFRLPTLAPATTSPLLQALEAARQRAGALAGSDTRLDPIILDWQDVEAGTRLTSAQNDAFCRSLGTPGLDDALATLVALGLNSLSVRRGRAPISDDVEKVIGLAATFAVETCPAWVPVVHPPPAKPTPLPIWQPAGFSIVIGDPDVVWRWWEPGTHLCGPAAAACWQIDVLARDGCDRVDAVLHVKNQDGAVVEVIDAAVTGVAAEQPTPMRFDSAFSGSITGSLIHLTCS